LELPPPGERVDLTSTEKDAAVTFQKLLVKHRVVVTGPTI
jgi:hypothetical protein